MQNFRDFYCSDMLGNDGVHLYESETLAAHLKIATLAVIPEPATGALLVIALAPS